MELIIEENLLKAYGFTATINIQQIGSGHINRTYLLSIPGDNKKYILQQINTIVFKNPAFIAENVKAVADFLNTNYPNYLFPAPIPTLAGKLMYVYQEEYWRLLPFIPDTIAHDSLSKPEQAYEAAKQFGKLGRLLHRFNPLPLKPTISGFHDLLWRYDQFKLALIQTSNSLKIKTKYEIELALHYHTIVDDMKAYQQLNDFPDRVMHHDTKISNVLLDIDNNGVCVIDLDTLMPGKFISDLGDMMRTYVCAFTENEPDLNKINIRLDYFKATMKGYLSEMAAILTPTEKELILFSGKYMIYMQGLRFLTDYLNGNIYYPISYPEQNLDRTKNQFKLLQEFFLHEKALQNIIDECLHTS